MASLIKQEGRYYLQFHDARRRPNRKRVSLRTRDRRLANEARRRLEAEYVLGQYDPWNTRDANSLRSLNDAYLAFMERKKNLRPSTRDHYRWVLRRFVDFVGESCCPAMLSWQDIGRWLESTGASHQSRHTYLTRVGIFCRFLVKQGVLAEDVSKDVPLTRPPQNLAEKVITEGQLQQIARCAEVSDTPYLAEIVVVTYDLALRLGEVCAMRKDWLNLSADKLIVRQGRGFTTKSGREVMKPIPPRARGILFRRSHGLDTGEHVFTNTRGSPLDPKRTSKAFKKIVRRLGMSESITFHGLRHGGITRLVESGVNLEVVRRFAGHADLSMTLRYVHLSDPAYEQAIRSVMT